MNLRRGFSIVTLLVALHNGAAAFADEPAGAAAPTTPPATQPLIPAPVDNPAQQAPLPAAQSAVSSAPPSAQSSASLSPATRATAPATGNMASMVSGLIFLLVLVLGGLWLIRRAGGMPAMRGGSSMKVVAALSVGPRERVVLIELSGQQWLLGVGGGTVNTLHHFEQPIVTGGGDDFAGTLRQLWPQSFGSQGQRK